MSKFNEGVFDFVSEELTQQVDTFLVRALPKMIVAMFPGSSDETVKEALQTVRMYSTPAISLLMNSASVLNEQARLSENAARAQMHEGRGPVATQQFIAQWLFEHPEVMADIVSDPRWDQTF